MPTVRRPKPDLFHRVVESIYQSIVIVDARKPDLPISYVNLAFERLTGFSSKESIGRNCRFLQGEDRHQPIRRILRKAIKQKEPVKVILRNYKKDGSMFWNELSISPLFDHQGKLDYFFSLQRDVTLHVKVERAEGWNAKKNLGISTAPEENEKNVARRKVVANIEQSLLPLLRHIEKSTDVDVRRYAEALKINLSELSSDFGLRLASPLYGLSPREIEVCHHVRQGLQTKEIALLLNISEATIENQRNAIRRKLGLDASAALVPYLRAF